MFWLHTSLVSVFYAKKNPQWTVFYDFHIVSNIQNKMKKKILEKIWSQKVIL